LELLIHPSPASDDAPCQCQEEKWRIGQKMFANKRNNFDRVQIKSVLDTATRSQMRKRDPGVLCVPHDWRHRAKSEYAEQYIESGTLEFVPKPGCQGQHHYNQNNLKR